MRVKPGGGGDHVIPTHVMDFDVWDKPDGGESSERSILFSVKPEISLMLGPELEYDVPSRAK